MKRFFLTLCVFLSAALYAAEPVVIEGVENSYRICGTKGQIENVRGEKGRVLLRYNKWDVPAGKEDNSTYNPAWNDPDEALIKKADHGGGDFLVIREFFDCIREFVHGNFNILYGIKSFIIHECIKSS